MINPVIQSTGVQLTAEGIPLCSCKLSIDRLAQIRCAGPLVFFSRIGFQASERDILLLE